MAWVLYIFAAMAVPPLCAAQGPAYEGKSLSMSGFHLCTKNETRNVSVLVVRNVARKEEKPCGGWLMWMTCTVTLYEMVHQTEYREVEHQVTRCCDGYEKVGRYCAPTVKRSDVLGAKPGSCPRADGFIPTSEDSGRDCERDLHCPDWQKCCPASNGSVCTDPHSVANAGRYRFNATVTVRTDYQLLLIKNGSLLNHTRILQAMVPGVLQADPLVYYLASWPVHPHRTATSLLIDSSSALSLHHVRSRLLLLLKHVQEVTSVSVDDVNECAHASLRHCSPHAECVNTVGSYQCTCTRGYLDADPVNTGVNCTAPAITSVQVANITGTSFCVYWSTESENVQAFRITVHTGSEAVAAWDTNNTLVKVEELKPAVLYNVSVELSIHGNQVHTVHIVVKTEAQTVDATTRLTNIQFTDDLMNSSSEAFRNLSDSIKEEIYRAHELEALVNSGQLRIEIKNFSPGSVVVNFTIVLIPSDSQDIANTSKVVINSLTNSSKYAVDEDSTSVTDFDECASGDHDCSQKADCINSWASYTCVCQDGFTDINTQRPGRACQAALRMTTTSLPTLSASSMSNTVFPPSTTTRASAPATAAGATTLTFSTVTTNAPTFTVPFSLSDAPTSVSTALMRSTTPTFSASPLSTVSSSTALTSDSTASRSEHTSPTTAPREQSSATTFQFVSPTSTSAAPMSTPPTSPSTADPLPQSTTSMSTPTTPVPASTASSSSAAPATLTTAPVTPSTAPFTMTTSPTPTTTMSTSMVPMTQYGTATTLPTASSSPATGIISSSTATSTSAPTSVFTTPSSTRMNPSGAQFIQSTTTETPTTAPTLQSTAPTAATIASPTPSTAPSTPSTAPSTPSTAPSTPSTAPSTPSTAPSTPSTAPSTPSTAPTVSTTAPTTLSTSHLIQTATTLTTSPETIIPSTTPKLPSHAPTTTTAATQTSTFTTPISLPLTSTALTTPPSLPTAMSQTSIAPKSNTTKCQESLLESISVQCRVAAITVTIARDVLQQCRIMESSLYLGLEDCGVNASNATHVQLTVAWNECATSLLHNDSAYTVTVTLLNQMKPYVSPTGTVEATRMRLQVPIMCTYMRSMLMSADFSSVGYDMIKDVISSSGSFHVTVQLLNGTVPLPHNYTLTSDDVVVVEVSMNTSVEQIKVVIHSCWATTSPNPADAIRYTFLDNRCSLNSYTKVLMNGNSSTSSVSVQIFSFVNAKMIYLHCQVQICVQMGSDTCVPDCVQRTARLSNTIGTAFGSSGPLLNAGEDSAVDESDTVYVVGIACLGVILTLAFVIGSVCLFYCQRNRIGHYNFNVKPKEEKFSYLVFNT